MIGFDSSACRRCFWRGAICALVAAGVLSMCMAPPAHAEPFATVTAGQVIVTLHTDQGPCVGRARLATFAVVGSDAPPVPGCWVLDGDQVSVSWLDGERANIPRAMLVKVRAS